MTHPVIAAAHERVLPRLTPANRPFWTSGAQGRLTVQHCAACGRWFLPSVDTCDVCGSPPTYDAVGGTGTVFTYTTNQHQFHPAITPPNLIAIVTLDEQDTLRLATNLVNCTENDVTIGMAVRVLFEDHGEVFYPVFTPAGPSR
ncbi:MAG TPA: OB-fold domain-containing protein [Mycobacteriales bacterium]|nr:OB-fold domain-containing protein [Mycobacteriales bacterium]